MKTKKLLLIVLSFFLLITSCSKQDSSAVGDDPIVGKWKIQSIITSNGSEVDVTNMNCLKNTNLNVTKSVFNYSYSSVNEDETGCDVDADSFDWIKKNGKYYGVEDNGDEVDMNIVFEGNNTKLVQTVPNGKLVFVKQ